MLAEARVDVIREKTQNEKRVFYRSTCEGQVQENGIMETKKEQGKEGKPKMIFIISGVSGRTGVVIKNLGFGVQIYLGLNLSITTY